MLYYIWKESLSSVKLLGTKFHRNPLNYKKLLIYVILFEKQFDDKIFETYRTQIYINNVDNDNNLLLFIVFFK